MRIRNVVPFAVVAFAALGTSPRAAAQECDRQSATGHVQFIGTVPNVNLGNRVEYSFTAHRTGEVDESGDCVVRGELEERVHLPDGSLFRHSHATVLCMEIAGPNARGGTTAWIGAEADRTTAAPPCDPGVPPGQCLPEGIYGGIEVEDNGEGAAGMPDRGSAVQARTAATIRAFCEGHPDRPKAELLSGNVQVRR